MSDRPDNSTQAGWYVPRSAIRGMMNRPAQPQTVVLQTLALPANIPAQAEERGTWHLPTAADTSFKPGDEVTYKRKSDGKPAAIRPEDLLAQVLNTTKAPSAATTELARPEDMTMVSMPIKAIAPAKTTPVEVARPEDLDFNPISATSTETAAETSEPSTEVPVLPLDGMDALAALGALDDAPEESISEQMAALPFEDDDDFSVSEYLALTDLEQAASKGVDGDTVPLGKDDLSRAGQAALLAKVAQASELLPKENAQESAADYARRMAQQLSNEGDAPTLDMPVQGETAADYARRMAAAMAAEAGPAASATPMTTLTPEERALAEKFRQTARGVGDLRGKYQRGELSQEEVQQRQREYQIYDERTQDWWMMGIDSGVWYRFDRATNEWAEQQPPVPLENVATPTATSNLRADDVISGSLPYLPERQGVTEISGTQVFDPFTNGNTPVPNPNQPQWDPNMTMVGEAAVMNTLPSNAATLPNMAYVDDQYTMPMNTVASIPAVGYDDQYAIGMDSAPNYDYQPAPTFESLRENERASVGRIIMLGLIVLFGCGVVSLVGSFVALQVWYTNTVTPYQAQIAGLATYKPSFQTARILDANGDLIVELNSQNGGARKVIPLTAMSPYVLHAVISSENPTFYDDPGFDIVAVFRAFLQNLGSGDIQSGASTITQQLARNLVLQDTSPTAERKITEIFVAMEISQQYTKNEILQTYMNETFFGNQSYGVEAASEFYFKHPAAELNMAEAALLAGIISSPAQYDPVVNFTAADDAMRVIISRMLDTGCLQFQHGQFATNNTPFCVTPTTYVDYNGEQAQLVIDNGDGSYGGLLALQLAIVETTRYLPREAQFKYPHFVNYVQAQVEQAFGANAMFQRGFTIYTTLNPRIQDAAEQALKSQVAALVNNGVNTGAVMATDPQTGAIRAMVGSPDFSDERIDGQVDNTRTWQQPGSSIKPIVYLAALEGSTNGYLTPASILWDVPSSYPIAGQQPYAPTNFSNTFLGAIPLRAALQQSINVAAVKAYEFIGTDKFVNMGQRLGLNFLPEAVFGLPSALGATDVRLIDMMKAYGSIANNGNFVPLYSIDRITEQAGSATLEVPLPEKAPVTQAITPQLAYLMQNILSDDNARAPQFGANGALTLANVGIPTQGYVGAKTGTTNEGRDLWTLGFTNNTVVGVWLGTFDNSPTVGVSGSNAPALIWNNVMATAISGRAPTAFQNPGGVVQNTVCRDTGTLAGANCANRTTEIYIQTQPPPPDTQGFVQTLNIDSWTGYVANEWCAENVVAQTFANITDPFALNWIQNTPQGRQWAQLVGLPANLAQAPTQVCSQGQVLPSVYINNPTNNQTVTGILTITGQISAPEFTRYDLEYSTAGAPTNFTRITTNTQQFPSAGSTLGTWDTATVPNGTYTLRLAAYSTRGGYVFKTVSVNINNIQPTATPLPVASPTSQILFPTPLPGFSTPLPFDSTATATIAP